MEKLYENAVFFMINICNTLRKVSDHSKIFVIFPIMIVLLQVHIQIYVLINGQMDRSCFYTWKLFQGLRRFILMFYLGTIKT